MNCRPPLRRLLHRTLHHFAAAGHAGASDLLMELLTIRLSEQTTLAKSLVMLWAATLRGDVRRVA